MASSRACRIVKTGRFANKAYGSKCAAFGCDIYQCEVDNSYFTFPKDVDRCKKWVTNIRRRDLDGWSSEQIRKNNLRVCALHFEDTQFMNATARNKLTPSAVPTIVKCPIPPPLIAGSREPLSVEQDLLPKKDVSKSSLNSSDDSLIEETESLPLDVKTEPEWDWTTLIHDDGLDEAIEEKPDDDFLPIMNEEEVQNEDTSSPNACVGLNEKIITQEDKDSSSLPLRKSKAEVAGSPDVFLTIFLSSKGEKRRFECCPVEDVQLLETEEEDYGNGGEAACALVKTEDGSFAMQRVVTIAPVRVNVSFGPYKGKISEAHAATIICSEAFLIYTVHSGVPQLIYQCGFMVTHNAQKSNINGSDCRLGFEFLNQVYSWLLKELPQVPYTISLNQPKDRTIAHDTASAHMSPSSITSPRIPPTGEDCQKILADSGTLEKSMNQLQGENPLLLRHTLTHVEKTSNTSEVCQKSISVANHSEKHTETQPEEKLCQQSIAKSRDLDSDMDTHIVEMLCTLDPKDSTTSRKGEKPHTCDFCQKSFVSRSQLKDHMTTHNGEKPFACEICQKCFARKSYLKEHMKVHTGEKPFSCEVCQKSFSCKSGLNAHIKMHKGEKPLPYLCDICGKCCAKKSHLRDHMRIHTRERPYTCEDCQKSWSSKSKLKLHMRTHTRERPYTCEVCQKSWSSNSKLKLHMRTHTGEKPHACDICSKSFTISSSLKVHRLRHTGEKPYACEVCQKSFSCKPGLNMHMVTHTCEKSFVCEVCQKSFKYKLSLTIHIRTHTGEKPYVCGVCQESFVKSSNCKDHMRRYHSEEKLFICEVCGKSYAVHSALKKHVKRSH